MILRSLLVFLGSAALLAAHEATFRGDVAPILYSHCVSCHHPNDIAPMSLETYQQVRPWAAAIKQAVLSRKMPPWKADPHYGKWSNDPSLTKAELETIATWADHGAPEGDGPIPSAPVFTNGWKIGKPDVIFTIPVQKLSGVGPDHYVYITVPTNFTEDKWVVAAELRPGNRRVVHHAHVFVVEDEKKDASAAEKPDPAAEYRKSLLIHEGTLEFVRPNAPVINDGCALDDNGLFPGSKKTDLSSLLSSYLPGRGPDVYPAGTARLIPAGAKLNFQIHYSNVTRKPETDASSVGLIFASQPPKEVARRIDLSNQMFMIPAGDPSQEVTECHTFSKDLYITSLTPHMHYRGKSMRFDVVYPDGRKETLLLVPAYNFHWQITYRAATPIFLPKGSRLEITAHFDNSVNNPLNPDPTKTIRWGAASETEMMDGWVEYVDHPPAALAATLSDQRK